MVDDGRGNLLCMQLDYHKSTNTLLWFWVDFSTCQGHYGGVITHAADEAVFYSIAVNTDKELLYVGHDGYVSVHKLLNGS